jgi:hypothetical protein
MGWPLALTGNSKKQKVEKEVAIITTNVKKLNQDAKKMGQALVTLNNNVALIDKTVSDIESANFDKPISFINNLELDDKYKKGLVAELNGTKQQALAGLKPIKNASEKIRGNMAVSMIKYQMMTKTLNIQKNVIESGTVQVEAIKKAEELGGMSSEKIIDLVAQAEEINNMTKSAVDSWSSGTKAIKETLGSVGGDDFDVFDIK